MAKNNKRYLTKRQKAVLDDLLAGEEKDMAVLKKHGVRLSQYLRWLRNDLFLREYRTGLESVKRQEGFYISRHVKKAAEKLVELVDCDKEETARKACLDILAYDSSDKEGRAKVESEAGDGIVMDDVTAGKVLGVVAERGRG